jgi:hypothetical protein
VKIFFSPILVESISFDAEPDEGEGYMVAFGFFCFYFNPNCDFWKKGEIP